MGVYKIEYRGKKKDQIDNIKTLQTGYEEGKMNDPM